MRKLNLVLACAALGVSGVASAETYTVTGGTWDSVATWSTNADGTPDTAVYDNGETAPVALLGGNPAPGVVDWTIEDTGVLGEPGVQTGTYSGTLETDVSGNVIGGSLIVTGTIAKQVIVGDNSWWTLQYEDMTIDFGTSLVTAGVNCWRTALAPAGCAAAVGSEPDSFAPIAGNEGATGAAREAATFDGTSLRIFHEGYDGATGTDYGHEFTLTADIGGGGAEPVDPAADLTEAGSTGGFGNFALLELSSNNGPSGSVNPQIRVFNGDTGLVVTTIEYFDNSAEAWQPIAIDTVADGNSDGTADDPAVVMLAENLVTGQIKVQARYISDGSKVRTNIAFFNPTNWSAIDVAVVNDINGDGTSGDTGIAVLAQSGVDSRYEVRTTPFNTVNNLPNWTERFFSPSDDVKAIESAWDSGGGETVIVALGEDGTGKSRIQIRQVSDGAKLGNEQVWSAGSDVDTSDLTVVVSDTISVLGLRNSNGNTVYRSISLFDGSTIGTERMLGTGYAPERITSFETLVAPPGEPLAASARNTGDDSLLLKLRSYSDNASIGEISP